MAPATSMGAGDPAAAGAAGPLPDLTGGNPAATGGAIADPTATAAAGQGAGVPADLGSLMKHGTWLGPLSSIGGGFAAYKGLQSGNKWMKFGGLAAALGGLALTGMGFKAKGYDTASQEAVAAMQQLDQQYQATMQNLATQASTQITTLQQQLAQAQAQAGSGTGVPGQGSADGSGGLGVGPGLDTTVVPQGTSSPIGEGSPTPQGQGGNPNATPQAQGTAGTTPTGATGIRSVVGTTVDLAIGNSPSGTPIAEQGTYRIEQLAGDPNGYATLDEANAAARQTMSTELMGSKFLRWMVVEQGGRYYGVVAKQLGEGQQPNPMTTQHGNVVAWSAMNHVSDNGVDGWKAYSWSQAAGAQVIDVPYGTTNVFGAVSGGGPIGANTSGGGPTGTAPGTGSIVDQAIASVTGGGPAAPSGAAFDPASQVGRSFAINASSTAEGDLARGGSLQVQRFVDTSSGGFGTAEEAAMAARAAREAAGGGNQWSRWLTLQGSDGRFYVYEGSIVARATAELQASPVHVFGVGFAEYFDGATSSWKAVREQQAA